MFQGYSEVLLLFMYIHIYVCVCVYVFFRFFSILVYHKIVNIVPCAIQQDLVDYLFSI